MLALSLFSIGTIPKTMNSNVKCPFWVMVYSRAKVSIIIGSVTQRTSFTDSPGRLQSGRVTLNSMAASCSGDLPILSKNGSQRGSE